MGHQVDACSYTVQKGKDLVTLPQMSPRDRANTSCIGHEGSTSVLCNDVSAIAILNRNETEEAKGQYGPWLVVTSKRGGHKGTRPSSIMKGPTKSVWKSTSHYPLKGTKGYKHVSQKEPKSVRWAHEMHTKPSWALNSPGPMTESRIKLQNASKNITTGRDKQQNLKLAFPP
nr:hypothetical protein CFP56_55218 [Quercus suber]